jgi:hypothetical protein
MLLFFNNLVLKELVPTRLIPWWMSIILDIPLDGTLSILSERTSWYLTQFWIEIPYSPNISKNIIMHLELKNLLWWKSRCISANENHIMNPCQILMLGFVLIVLSRLIALFCYEILPKHKQHDNFMNLSLGLMSCWISICWYVSKLFMRKYLIINTWFKFTD